ncbi:putative transposase/invertase (TIGR01784 family) [Evansella vedderi]|uniref:Transposase/invertase (TIGR01784 family) n=1 Tax=Evansella vedderi TaxID=38282 RepID=A0ABT9ZT79_9BACI|nr:putative transposase/invertase (TIGR01784 family) [Evansella vedderi]
MGYNSSEKIEVKKAFFRMLLRLELDKARESLIAGFFDTYLKLNEKEEKLFLEEVRSMSSKEGEKIMEIMTSYERKGIEKGVMKVAKRMLLKNMPMEEIVDITGLPMEEIERLKEEL